MEIYRKEPTLECFLHHPSPCTNPSPIHLLSLPQQYFFLRQNQMQKLSEQKSKNKTVLEAFSFPHSHCQPHISLRVFKIEFISKHTPSSPPPPQIKITRFSQASLSQRRASPLPFTQTKPSWEFIIHMNRWKALSRPTSRNQLDIFNSQTHFIMRHNPFSPELFFKTCKKNSGYISFRRIVPS